MLRHVPAYLDTHLIHFRHTESHDHVTTLGPAPTQLHILLTNHMTTLGPAQLQLSFPSLKSQWWQKDPPLFEGQREKADTFINEVEKYLTLNYNVAGFNSLKKKVTLVLTFMQGPEVEEWTRGMLQWIQQIDDQSNIDNVWCIFLWWFFTCFQDTQVDSMARNTHSQLKMRFPYIDSYIADFKQLIRKALYWLGSHEMNQQFLSGLPWDVAEDVMRYPTPIMYQEYSQKALASVQSKTLLKNIFRGGNKNFGTFAPQQWPQWNNPCPQGQNTPHP